MMFMRDVLPTASVLYKEYLDAPPPRNRWSRSPVHCSYGLALCFLLAGALTAAQVAATPFERGWWLVAYLVLVGGVAQILLVRGRELVLIRAGLRDPRRGWLWAETLLWNLGTVSVPFGVFTDSAPTAQTASVALLSALALYAAGLRRAGAGAQRPARGGAVAYYALASFLVGSVLIGTGLAGALPWQ